MDRDKTHMRMRRKKQVQEDGEKEGKKEKKKESRVSGQPSKDEAGGLKDTYLEVRICCTC